MRSYTLDDSLRAIEPHLRPLIAPEPLERLRAVGRCFPDALADSFGFEYRLHPPAASVDFAFHIAEAERDILAGLAPHVRLATPFAEHPVWQRIRRFCAAWADPGADLHHRVADLWLEFDVEADGATAGTGDPPVPGLLFRPASPPDVQTANPGSAPSYAWVWERALPLLSGGSLSPAVQDTLIACLTHLPAHTHAYQIGLMLGRRVDAVRLCLVGSPAVLLPYLGAMGWTGSLAEVEAIAAALQPYVDGILLDIDVGARLYPRIGLEGIYLTRYLPCVDGRWQALLDHLVAQGLCSPPTRDVLLAYCGYNLAQPLHRRIYVRGLNHIKLVYQPGLPLAAKVYFGAMHKPISAIPTPSGEIATAVGAGGVEGAEDEGCIQQTGDRAGARRAGEIQTQEASPTIAAGTITSAVSFLLAARDTHGWWTDFLLAAGISDEWVTGYVGTMLATVPDDRVAGAVANAWRLLQTRSHRADGAWGYNRFPPGDADSTGWALQLAHALGESESDRACRAVQALDVHVRPDGGLSTYAREGPIRAFIHAAPETALEGWCGSHTCVSAALAALPDYRCRLRGYLHATQQRDGGWPAYWWHDPEYATALAAEALAAIDLEAEQVARAVAWGLSRLGPQGYVATGDHPSGSPFATAWCLRLLLLGRADGALRETIAATTGWLRQQQQPDGSWASSARLRVPHSDDLNPNRYDRWTYHGAIQGSLVFDRRRVFTTATVLQALSRSVGAQ